MDGLGFGWNSVHAFVTYNGNKQYDPTRYYFISRHDHHLPTTFTYLVHATLDNNMIDLGSWHDPRQILAIKNEPAPLPPFDIEVINVNYAPAISGTPDSEVVSGTGYEFTPNVSDPDGDILTFSIINQPAWASFDHATGILSGTPAAEDAGQYNDITITVSDAEYSDSITFTISVYEPLVVNAYEKYYYQNQYSDSVFNVWGGVPPYTVTLESGSFPPGVDFLSTTVSTSSVKYGGTPTEMGSWSFSIKATDSVGYTAVSDIVNIHVVEGIVITTPSLPDAVTGQPYSVTIAATGGHIPGNYSWRMKTSGYQVPAGLSFPDGLTLYPESTYTLAETATISGIPTTAGTYEFIIEAQEPMWGGWDRVYFTINVADPCTDSDGDGYAIEGGTCGPVDCNDADTQISPGAFEISQDGIDQDCNGYDLTLNVTKAGYSPKKEELEVTATSAYNQDAGLELEGYGPMDWNAKKGRWELEVSQVAQGDAPVSVTVFGLEGSDSLPVTWK